MNGLKRALKIILTVILGILSFVSIIWGTMLLDQTNLWVLIKFFIVLIIPLLIPLVWLRNKKLYIIIYSSVLMSILVLIGCQLLMTPDIESITVEEAATIDVTPNINVNEYMPFDEDSKIVQIDSQTLDFENIPNSDLPIIDGATAAFPVYSAFVNAVYPESTQLYDGIFEYNNTVGGYEKLAERETDIFIGAAPSQEQIAYAEECGTVFEFTQIGYEAFVFFVHKDNPIDSLTLDQIKGIYSGEITNWNQVGGDDEQIVPYQRDEGSGSQSMLIRLMGDTPIIEPDIDKQVGFMGGIIEEVADYKSAPTSIGFSFRFYVEGIIKNPDIKMIAVNGIAPTKENIQNSTYPIIAPVYAVTYEGNTKETVSQLISWILSDEGQYIIDKSGYVGMK